METACDTWSATQVRKELLRYERHRWTLSQILFDMLKKILTLCAVAVAVRAQQTPVCSCLLMDSGRTTCCRPITTV